MTVRRLTAAVLAPVFLALAGCGQGEGAWTADPGRADADVAAEAGYLVPPQVTEARAQAGGGLALGGLGAPGARVRIAPPAGAAIVAVADAQGRWRAAIPAGPEVRLFGVSMTAGGRSVQSEGYLMLTREGRAAQLRAGAGAAPLSAATLAPRILAVDYDRDGGAIVSGVAAPGAGLSLRVDKSPRGETKADARGRFSISLTEPLGAGRHSVEVAGEGGEDVVVVDAARAGAIGPGPFLGRRTAYGWRVDWMTPGGGVQTTQVFDRGAGA